MLAFLTSLAVTIKLLIALLGTAGFWKYVVVPIRKALKRIESIGENGQETIFQMLHRLSDQIDIQGSLMDVMTVPMFITDKQGRMVSANLACSRLLGWNLEELKHGGLRSLMDRDSQEHWDDAIENRAIFERNVRLKDLTVHILAKPMPANSEKFLGWRGAIHPMAAER